MQHKIDLISTLCFLSNCLQRVDKQESNSLSYIQVESHNVWSSLSVVPPTATMSLANRYYHSIARFHPQTHPPTEALRASCAGFAGEKRRVFNPAQKPGELASPQARGWGLGPPGPGARGPPLGGIPQGKGFFRGKNPGI